MTHRSRTMASHLSIALFLGTSIAAMAQQPALPPAPVVADAGAPEIVVTAQKRSERLQDVPVSITALTGDSIRKQRITQADDLVSKIPNLQLTATVGENTPIFALRGVSMSDYSLNQSGPVATYYDEVYKGNFALLGVALYDLERVEVLRGPQGTLYGKNTTGGAVNLISKKPEFNNSGYINLGYGNYNRLEANGAINVKLAPTLAARIAFTAEQADGWFVNKLPGKPNLDDVREYAVRGSLLWEPADGVSFLLRGSTSLQNPHNYGIFAQPGPFGVGNGVYEANGQGTSYFRTGLNSREIQSNYTPRRYARTYATALTTNVRVADALTVTSVTSYDYGSLQFGEDTDGSPTRTLEIPYTDKVRQFTEDLRLTSSWKGPFNFILGAYYNREAIFNSTAFTFFGDLDVNHDGRVDHLDCATSIAVGSFNACAVTNRFDQLKHSYAAYTDLRYDFGSGFTLRGGLRFTHDDGRQTGLLSQATGVDGVIVSTLIPNTDRSFKTDNISGKIGVDYKVAHDILLYGNYSRGYRGRSFNAQAFFDASEASVARPETLDAFEVGAKTRFLDRRITLNGAAFYYIYQNQQFITVNPTTGAQTLDNVERSRIFGGEFELTARATDKLGLHTGLGLLSTRIEKGSLSGVDLIGKLLSNAPVVTASGGVDLTLVDSDKGKLSFHPDISYVASQYFEVFNLSRLQQHDYALVSAHLDFEHGNFSASLWGKNLTDKFFFTSRVDLLAGFGYDYNHVGAPRTFGGTVGYKF